LDNLKRSLAGVAGGWQNGNMGRHGVRSIAAIGPLIVVVLAAGCGGGAGTQYVFATGQSTVYIGTNDRGEANALQAKGLSPATLPIGVTTVDCSPNNPPYTVYTTDSNAQLSAGSDPITNIEILTACQGNP
jgi:hypothetical protein